jgi:hypothetical protein
MTNKQQILTALAEIFNRWQVLLASLSNAQITEPLLPSSWTVKDIVAHLWAWQQASVARMQAALQDRQPEYPRWWEIFGPDPEEDVDRTNAWIYEANRDIPWSTLLLAWKAQFMQYLELIKKVPEKDLLQEGRFKWMGSYPLSASPMGSCEHHEEHIDTLLAWLIQHGYKETG